MASPTLDRVRKLLALAGSPNVHEAAAAAARAQALIAEHRLEGWLAAETVDALDPIEDARDTPLEVARRLRRWRVVLACALADLNGCAAYTLDRGDDHVVVLIGTSADREAVRALYDGLVKRIEWLSATHGAGRSRRWHEGFRVGAVDTVIERLREGQCPIRHEDHDVSSNGTLVRVEQLAATHRERLDRFVAERARLKPGRALRVERRAWDLGRAHGAALDLPASTEGS